MDHGEDQNGNFIFTKNIINGKPINIFNYGKMKEISLMLMTLFQVFTGLLI